MKVIYENTLAAQSVYSQAMLDMCIIAFGISALFYREYLYQAWLPFDFQPLAQ